MKKLADSILKILIQDGISHPSIVNYTLSADACNKTKQMAYCIRQSTKSVTVGIVLSSLLPLQTRYVLYQLRKCL